VKGTDVLNFAVKSVLSLIAIIMLLLALNLVMFAHRAFTSSQAGLKNPPPIFVGQPRISKIVDSSVHPLWPEFPHNSGASNFHSSLMNGVQMMAEDWDCGSPPDEILAYYRDQMAARGWQDTTKETYGLKPELRTSANDVETPDYINNYQKIMSSTLMFNREGWSLKISAEPSKRGFHQTTVAFYAIASPSVVDFFQQMASSVVGNQNKPGKPLDVVQDNGTEHYHTTVLTRTQSADQTFGDELKELEKQGWKPAVFLPQKETPNGHFAWLVRGKQYAALSVTKAPQGQGSSATFTEVTPR
jgi:hypothetical protein